MTSARRPDTITGGNAVPITDSQTTPVRAISASSSADIFQQLTRQWSSRRTCRGTTSSSRPAGGQ